VARDSSGSLKSSKGRCSRSAASLRSSIGCDERPYTRAPSFYKNPNFKKPKKLSPLKKKVADLKLGMMISK
jgi:hypothetical protein